MPNETQTPEYLWFLDGLMRIHVAHSEGTDGLSVIEHRAPYGDSPPLHVHHTEDELFHVLEGELRFVSAGTERRAGAGELILTPKGVPHSYRVESPAGARWLVITTRGDFEGFVREISRPAADRVLPPGGGPPTPEQVQALADMAGRHQIELVGPPLH